MAWLSCQLVNLFTFYYRIVYYVPSFGLIQEAMTSMSNFLDTNDHGQIQGVHEVWINPANVFIHILIFTIYGFVYE